MTKGQYVMAVFLTLLAAREVAAQGGSQNAPMTFFVTSVGAGNGANLGGLAGADAHCQKLATASGAGGRTWRAYLSASASSGQATVNARDRIGRGPWHNAKGAQIAANVADLHSDNNKLNKETALSEKGEPIKARGETPNEHDILTGSRPDGTAFPNDPNLTCGNWTVGNATNMAGAAQIGHHDRQGNSPSGVSWNSAHATRGCGLTDLRGSGGAGLLYCFAQ
jgi:hypothetical protein